MGLSVHLYLSIAMGGVKKTATIGGMFNDWMEKKGTIENIDFLGNAESLVSCFKNREACYLLK